MLSSFQETKLRLFFDILDFDRNGIIEANDFNEIGDNFCIMLDIKQGSPGARLVESACKQAWNDLYHYIDVNKDGKATIDEWLKYADEKIVNCDAESYNLYINRVIHHLFNFFDNNNDNRISLNEYLNLFMAFGLEVKYSAKAFLRLDLDGDEMISKEELYQAVEQFFRSDKESDKGNWLFGSWEKLAV